MTPSPSTFSALLEVYHAEISLTVHTKHDHHVTGDIVCYATQFYDQNATIDQRDPLYDLHHALVDMTPHI